MSRQTTNYGLTKPDYTDTADIEVVNSNMDIIDEALKVIDTKSNNVMSKNSSAWSSTVAYAVGQYCIYNNSLWKCLVQHSGQTPQEGTYWARVSLDTLGSEISAINQNLSELFVTKQFKINGNSDSYYQENNTDITLSGYKPLAIAGFGCYNITYIIDAINIANTNNLYTEIHTTNNSTISSYEYWVYVVYQKVM